MSLSARWITGLIALAALGGLGWAGLGWAGRAVRADLETPRDLHGAPHATSLACARCHPGQHDSWHHTFHRTMTQEASEASVLGDFEGARFEYGGVEARMEREPGGGFAMRFLADGVELSRARIVRTVGSHRYQQYLAAEGDVLFRLPMAWHVEEGRWFHMNGAFLTPDPPAPPEGGHVAAEDYHRHVVRWNDNCVFCHNVAPNPGRRLEGDAARFETELEELGVACEACHGPADEHARVNANPVRRYALHLSDTPDPTVVNPRRLSPARSAEICGRCHGQRITDDVGRFLTRGDPFVPGDRLADYSRPLARDTALGGDEAAFEERFWPDGTARLTAYEYQGLLASPCEELTCTSCHGMHEGDPSGQLRPGLEGDAQCAQCHEADGHSAHEATLCVDCHMPRVVYGLIGAYRSHRIEIPDPGVTGRPDACSLCHAERDGAWIADGFARLYGGERPSAQGGVRDGLLGGDPIERAMAAAALGRGEALRDRAWRAGLLLDTLAEDPYPAVRRMAWRSLRALYTEAPMDWMGFVPTAAAGPRRAWVERAEATLSVRRPPRSQTAPLRQRAAQQAISIGE